MPRTDVEIRSLLTATDVDVLPDTSIVVDRGEYVVVRTPTNPTYFWGNFLMWRRAPEPGDRERWERAFAEEFGSQRESRHVSLCWDLPGQDGAFEQFVEAGYCPDRAVALVAEPDELVDHPRANRDVSVRALDIDGDEELWAAVVELQVDSREEGHSEASYRRFVTARMEDRRVRFREGDGAWFVAQLPSGEVAASCGVVVTQGRGRYQAVDTAIAHRRLGIARRLVSEAGHVAVARFGARQLVIGADAEYHALALYESLGFTVRERCLALCWWPGAPGADAHPAWGEHAGPAD
jgi:ribosomal protein S18 acetylase RimI-like enzyme